MEYNQTFSRAAALSPSLWVAPGKLEKLIREAQLLPDTIVYMDYGEHEMKMRSGMERHFKNIAARLLEQPHYTDAMKSDRRLKTSSPDFFWHQNALQ